MKDRKRQTKEAEENTKNSVKRLVMVILSILLQVIWIISLAVKLTNYYAAISTLSSILALILVFRVYGLQINSAYKISWIILILLFPIMGVCLYLMFGRTGALGGMRKWYDKVHNAYAHLLPQDEQIVDKLEMTDLTIARQSGYLRKGAGYPVYQNTDVEFYGDTTQALEAQKTELRKAKKFIFMEYHAIEDSVAWRGIEEILEEKAAAGLDVRVFYDDMGSIGFISKDFMEKLQRKGIQCKVFNPLIPILNVFMNNRDHRKITVIDGKVGFTGGYNLANEYFNLTHPYGEWKDSGVKLTGDGVRSLTLIFLEMWNANQKKQEDPVPYLLKPAYRSAEAGFVQPYADSPLDGERTGENAYLNMIKSAKKYVYITTPYLIISDEMQRTLILAAKSGVDVRIITPGIPDKPLIYKVTRSYYAGLAAEGVRIYEYTPGFIHSKQMVCDDEVAVVGTINLDFRSLYLHFENACWFAGCRAVAEVRHDFEKMFPICREVTEKYSKKRSLALRGWECILRMFSPLM